MGSAISEVCFSKLSGLLVFAVLTLGPAECVNCSEPTAIALLTALRESVFGRTEIRPVISLQTPTVISLDFYIYGILGVVSNFLLCSLATLTLPLIIQISHFSFSMKKDKFWRCSSGSTCMDENKVPATYYLFVDHKGRVEDSLPVHVVSSCNLDIYTFPFDIQNCSYTFNSYLHPMSDVQLSFADEVKNIYENSLSTIGTNGEWELIGIIPEKPERDTNIVLRRKAAVYVVNLLLPSCFLVALDVFSFLLPAQHVDRSAFKMTLILGYTVFLLLMNDLLPVTGNNIPLINVFFSVCLALMVGSLLETILITNLLCASGCCCCNI
ncbi:5-hydroxytryptamine receptor 3C [Salminus brasiliensis]|uniref:5-hydroxytryptamine receptor 3C n=1 Tax=Salminus brasiliensis TaxID=930266 RepID=UPI003B832AB9